MKTLRWLHTLANAAVISLCMSNSWGETQSANFEVRITLNARTNEGLCTHQLDSQASNAIVKVVCSSGQFVSIQALPNRPFLGTQGGAHQFWFSPLSGVSAGFVSEVETYIGNGTVSFFRVINLNYLDGPLEMWLSF
ncbi:MAG: hypothetical protein K1X48_06420 [Burkholderiaceae bacterium]|nr:hypothetical protein [Burkholderiaceae bacterium]